jgi:membrane protein DedA with SNARE-associated domain
MPFLAGISHMRYRRFLGYNAAGGLAWGVGCVLLGYLAGNSYTMIERTFGRAAALAFAALALFGIVLWSIRRHRQQRGARPHNGPDAAGP